MSYQVLARKWRPQRFDDVIGQTAVTRTLQNALKSGRLAQAFVFAGPRGCGKTTTARLLTRALNCASGPTAEPCGTCDACVEIAEGRDIDVLEIDAATHTGVDNIRDVIIEGLSITPVRDRYRVFIIDEVHMLSSSSFNALLKSIEEPPPHVVFMMATTEVNKIPDTVISRSQVYDFKTISAKVVADRLRVVATAEAMQISDAALLLLARAGEGSMRDSLSALDQVRAFAGDSITDADVVNVLGLVGRDLVLDMLEALADEDAARGFALVERAIERGYDLRLLCRELARATRDLLILSVDPARAADGDVASEGERERLLALSGRSGREDLLRAFDLLTRSEEEIRLSEQPRYNMEMTLIRLMHLRKLVPLAELIADADRGGPPRALRAAPAPPTARPASMPFAARPISEPSVSSAARPTSEASASSAARSSSESSAPSVARSSSEASAPSVARPTSEASASSAARSSSAPSVAPTSSAFLSEVKSAKSFFFNMVLSSAYRVDVTAERITIEFLPNQKVPRKQCDEARPWLETIAEKLFGHRVPVTVTVVDASAAAPAPAAQAPAAKPSSPTAASEDELRNEALADPTVQALFEIFPVERTKVEEM